MDTYQAPNPEGDFDVTVSPDSKRLQILEPFKAWDGKDLEVRPALNVSASRHLHIDSCVSFEASHVG